jgi:D-amino peptidase
MTVKVYVSVDMEGLAGVSHPDPTGRGDAGYPAAVALMVGETNAAIEGAFAAGATDVVVNDSHGSMFNLDPETLDPRARVIRGQKAWSMVEGAQPGSGFGVALFVGYHARAGHPTGTIAHTYSYAPTLTTLDGRAVGETSINAMVLGAWGIPVGMVAGDDALAEEVAGQLPDAERVVVKEAVTRHAALSLHPEAARARIRAGAEHAVRRAIAGEFRPFVVGRPVVLAVEWSNAAQADLAAIVPLVERYGDRGTRVTTDDPVVAYRAFLAGVRLASLAA